MVSRAYLKSISGLWCWCRYQHLYSALLICVWLISQSPWLGLKPVITKKTTKNPECKATKETKKNYDFIFSCFLTDSHQEKHCGAAVKGMCEGGEAAFCNGSYHVVEGSGAWMYMRSGRGLIHKFQPCRPSLAHTISNERPRLGGGGSSGPAAAHHLPCN